MPESVPERWEEIERQYTEGADIALLARRFHVSRARIKRRASRCGWRRSTADIGNVPAPEPTPDGSPSPSNGSMDQDSPVLNQRAALAKRQRAAWAKVDELKDDAFRVLRAEEPKLIPPVTGVSLQDRISLAAELMAMFEKEVRALSLFQEEERRAHGLHFKQLREARVVDEATDRRRRELVASLLSAANSLLLKQADNSDGTEPAS